MARLPYLEQSDLAPEYQHILKRRINLFRAMVNSPDAASVFFEFGEFIRWRSKLDPRLRELAILQVGYLARSVYEYTHHVKLGLDFGVTPEDIHAIGEETAGRPSNLEPLAKTVLRAAREMTQNVAMSGDTFETLRKDLSPALITDLVLTIAFYNAVVRYLETMQIDNEPEFQKFLADFPLPK